MLIDDIALTMHPEAGCRTVVHLLACFGSAENVYAATEEELRRGAGLKASVARSILNRETHPKARAELEFIARSHLNVLTSDSAGYPRRLLECEDYPHVLYVSGHIDFNAGHWLSVVGTRKITAYGSRMCETLIGQLARLVPDLVIVSGLAYGVDVAAHRAAMHHGIPTVGVLGHPINRIYPPPHTDTARRMVTQGGAVLSEFSSGEEPLRSGFVQRNRIIAGLSEGTLVVESASRGGSLITADMADGYHRTLMAVPGRIGDTYSEGPNRLIRSLKAQMVCSGEEIAELMNWDAPASKAVQPELFSASGEFPLAETPERQTGAAQKTEYRKEGQAAGTHPPQLRSHAEDSVPTPSVPENPDSQGKAAANAEMGSPTTAPETDGRDGNQATNDPPGLTGKTVQKYPRARAAEPQADEALSPAAQQLLEMIGSEEAVSMDELCLKAPFPAADLALLLLDLEFCGRICSLPGNRYLKY